MNNKPVIVSGIQPTGNLHLGNYLGAVKNWVDLQNSGKYRMYIFIADLHSLAGNMPAEQRRKQIIETTAELLAAGIDPKKTTLFVQSQVKEHTELGWIFNCVTPIAELERMTQYKDKSQQQEKNINAGLFTYPVLQAADILLYRGNVVPVGQDQVQHVELTRDIARWFNNRYGVFFQETKHLLTDVPKVMSLLEPDKKMSKSLGAGHVIELADTPEVIEQKLKKAVTATSGGEQAPGVKNLLLLLQKFGNQKIYQGFIKAEKDGSIRYGDLKLATGKAIGEYFSDFRKRRAKLLSNPNQLKKILTAGAKKAGLVAKKTMKDARKKVGIS
ncbi:MAG: tryptophan--tRNA ligase [Candidatus Magasanikbacteria bacterium RIFCSPLOWO2_12_FULL_43_12]|uniref:Tryptophan--tRNA ligase n=1 Tax=Candidatus Magasanikbacteria bacterium RIFCSPLOWO2_12_FULL_43_12 TaxID=1798692 RepID=A0A1F6MRS2_9BACT|nr:MAG: tryptophan--tRNA ligase [Candidatus Magasanikbacteria bacterium RIFCSPHIGHO2_02_FULL_44_13]OGH72543.1 MAG: tryptophan--tRNA ligase [Candidatus Magasanikbacteria bacterium RIFCSPLOWO2_02_FULL_43_22]OGH74248.1 MAG: tryptophan--tRNA ligase [Candidatus Magasanikbacteria bacterium RIFCSPLOWO2_12_FULL_43_12]